MIAHCAFISIRAFLRVPYSQILVEKVRDLFLKVSINSGKSFDPHTRIEQRVEALRESLLKLKVDFVWKVHGHQKRVKPKANDHEPFRQSELTSPGGVVLLAMTSFYQSARD